MKWRVHQKKELLKYAKSTILGRNILDIPKSCKNTLGKNTSKYSKLKSIRQPIYFVGSGSSYSVALFAESILRRFTNIVTYAYANYDYMTFAQKTGTTIVISQGGASTDTISAVKKAEELQHDVYAISGARWEEREKNLFRFLDKNHVFNIHNGVEDSFVNSKGVCASILIALELIERLSQKQIINRIRRNPHFFDILFKNAWDKLESFPVYNPLDYHYVCLGSGITAAPRNELELKICEAILEESEQSELKNYTHGRFMRAIQRKSKYFFIYLGERKDIRLINFLRSRLKDFPSIVIMGSYVNAALNGFELMIRIMLVTLCLSFLKNKYLLSLKKSNYVFDPGDFRLPMEVIDINMGFDMGENR